MSNKLDFGQSLLQAMEAAVARKETGVFVKAALALRAWYRHEALGNRPEMVAYLSSTVVQVYGGTRIQRLDTGVIQCFMGTGPEPVFIGYLELATIGQWLSSNARKAIQADYKVKVQAFVAENVKPEQSDPMDKLLTSLHDYVVVKLNVPWWRPKSTHADDSRVLGKLVWTQGVLSREIFGLAVRVRGFRFTADIYNQCAENQVELTARIQEAPNLAPWLYGTDHSHQLRVHQTVWQDLKLQFLALKGTQQAWKWFCNQGAMWFRHVQLSGPAVAAINRIAEMQLGKVPYHRGFCSALVYRTDARFFEVFKAAVVAQKKRKIKVADFQDYILIFDYLERGSVAEIKGATWASLMRKQRAWHTADARLEVERRKESGVSYGWVPLTEDIRHGALEAISLNASDDLWEEGGVMRHCVGGYDNSCYHNQSRIYSIRKEGLRVATLELKRLGNKWTIGQLYGAGNRRVTDKAVGKLAKSVLAAGNRAYALNLAENKVLRKPKVKLAVSHATPQVAPQPAIDVYEDHRIPF